VAWTLATLKQAAIDVPEVPRSAIRVPIGRRKTADWDGVACVLVASQAGGFVCKMCFSKFASRSTRVKLCSGLNNAAKKVAAFGHAQGHELWVGRQVGGQYDGSPVFMCRGCGAYASLQCKQLKAACSSEWGGRRNGHKRFMAGKHPCLPRVTIEGHRATELADLTAGVASCERHSVFWSHASVGGRRRAAAPGDDHGLVSAPGPDPPPPVGSGSSRSACGEAGPVRPPVIEAPTADGSPSVADLHGDGIDVFGPDLEDEASLFGGLDSLVDFSAREADEFFGTG
jgi:hypothetical protein